MKETMQKLWNLTKFMAAYFLACIASAIAIPGRFLVGIAKALYDVYLKIVDDIPAPHTVEYDCFVDY